MHVIQDEHDYIKPPEVTQDSDHTLEEPEKPDRARWAQFNMTKCIM